MFDDLKCPDVDFSRLSSSPAARGITTMVELIRAALLARVGGRAQLVAPETQRALLAEGRKALSAYLQRVRDAAYLVPGNETWTPPIQQQVVKAVDYALLVMYTDGDLSALHELLDARVHSVSLQYGLPLLQRVPQVPCCLSWW